MGRRWERKQWTNTVWLTVIATYMLHPSTAAKKKKRSSLLVDSTLLHIWHYSSLKRPHIHININQKIDIDTADHRLWPEEARIENFSLLCVFSEVEVSLSVAGIVCVTCIWCIVDGQHGLSLKKQTGGPALHCCGRGQQKNSFYKPKKGGLHKMCTKCTLYLECFQHFTLLSDGSFRR